jgi:hypothetical protein
MPVRSMSRPDEIRFLKQPLPPPRLLPVRYRYAPVQRFILQIKQGVQMRGSNVPKKHPMVIDFPDFPKILSETATQALGGRYNLQSAHVDTLVGQR